MQEQQQKKQTKNLFQNNLFAYNSVCFYYNLKMIIITTKIQEKY